MFRRQRSVEKPENRYHLGSLSPELTGALRVLAERRRRPIQELAEAAITNYLIEENGKMLHDDLAELRAREGRQNEATTPDGHPQAPVEPRPADDSFAMLD